MSLTDLVDSTSPHELRRLGRALGHREDPATAVVAEWKAEAREVRRLHDEQIAFERRQQEQQAAFERQLLMSQQEGEQRLQMREAELKSQERAARATARAGGKPGAFRLNSRRQPVLRLKPC